MLASGSAAGAFAMSVALMALPPIRRTGCALLLAVVAFGAATVVFGLSRSFPLSLAAYTLTGVADQLSMVMRHTTNQLATPDGLRGLVGASNQVGALESGFVAAWAGAVFAVVSGDIGCIAVAGFVAVRMPGLRRYRLAERDAPLQPATAASGS